MSKVRNTFASRNVAEFPHHVTAARVAPRQRIVERASQRIATVVAHICNCGLGILLVRKHINFGEYMLMRKLRVPALAASTCQSLPYSTNILAAVSRVQAVVKCITYNAAKLPIL